MNSTTQEDYVKRYVVDTNSLIYYFSDVFGQGNFLTKNTNSILEQAFVSSTSNILLSIPSIVFVEIYEKFLVSEELMLRFYYEVFLTIKNAPNMEIRPLDKEVLENIVQIRGVLENHDLHDKIIVASAIVLECPIITTDGAIVRFSEQQRGTLKVLS